MNVLSECTYMYRMCFWCLWVSEEGVKSPGTAVWQLWAAIRVLGVDPGFSERVATALSHQTISPALVQLFEKLHWALAKDCNGVIDLCIFFFLKKLVVSRWSWSLAFEGSPLPLLVWKLAVYHSGACFPRGEVHRRRHLDKGSDHVAHCTAPSIGQPLAPLENSGPATCGSLLGLYTWCGSSQRNLLEVGWGHQAHWLLGSTTAEPSPRDARIWMIYWASWLALSFLNFLFLSFNFFLPLFFPSPFIFYSLLGSICLLNFILLDVFSLFFSFLTFLSLFTLTHAPTSCSPPPKAIVLKIRWHFKIEANRWIILMRGAREGQSPEGSEMK